jgi:hypothetical protein
VFSVSAAIVRGISLNLEGSVEKIDARKTSSRAKHLQAKDFVHENGR